MISRWTVLNGLLVAIVALLAVEIGRTWMRTVPPLRMPATGDPAPRRDSKSRPSVDHGRVEEDVALISSMDLFDPSRQAPGTATEPVVAEAPPPTGIEVVGIRMIAGDLEAFIRDASQGNAQRRVRTGDEVAGYTVEEIQPTNVVLGNAAGQSVTLYLQLAPSGGARPALAAAAPGGARPGTPLAPRPGGQAGQSGQSGQGTHNPPRNPNAERLQQRLQQRQQRLQQQRSGSAVPSAVQERLNSIKSKKGA
ncbi:MAG TPA: hypothetical protein VNO26_13145 [Candidatus Limnocylindria bacterium]|nr:hypothetical protein [Candidatus Limnocylindria bacterium]